MVGCDFTVKDPANIPAAICKIEQAMTPATVEQCEGWLVLLQAATAHRADSDATSAVAYTLYASELRRWPADVAKAACEQITRGRPGQTGPNWFPTLAELVARCELMAAPRMTMLLALKRWNGPREQPYPSARGRPEPTEAEKEQVRRMAADALQALADTAEARRPKASEQPSIAGKLAEGSAITPEMQAVLARQRGAA